jgi:hypothetical protein
MATYHAGRGSSEAWKSAKPRGSEHWKRSRLKRLVADQAVQIHVLKEVNAKSGEPSAKRRAVKMSVEEGIRKVAAACRALGRSRSSYYRSGRSSLKSRRIRKEVRELSEKHPRYGYRLITALMRREASRSTRNEWYGFGEKGIKVSKKQRRMSRLGISTADRQRAERAY